MSALKSIVPVAIAVWLAAVSASAQSTATPVGNWAGVVVVNGVDIPFTFEISSKPARAATAGGQPIAAAFFDGDLRIESTGGSFADGVVTVRFDQYGTRLDATFRDDRLEGTYDRGTRGAGYAFRAERAVARPVVSHAPDIAGVWIIPTTSTKGEKAFRFIVRQKGADVSAAILRVDGDTGTLSGSYRDGTFVLSHFSGVRPTLLEVSVNADGTLALLQNKRTQLTAVREAEARKAALPEPTDSEAHTRAKDPSQPLVLAFPSLDGPAISLADTRFTGKVVIVSITGSWCPNCHDETPFLVDLYKKYRGLGLEVVAVTFEEAAQLKDPVRVRAFAKRYGITYPILLAGEPDELNAKVPQFENLNAFPTSFYLGRDGRVRFIHAGFPSPASGPFYLEAQQDIVRQVEQLLAEK
jgi:thiol-disulfide isomerase/thioredoxin